MKQTKKNTKWLWAIVAVLLVAAAAFWCATCAADANGVESTLKLSTTTALLTGIFVVAALGYLLGSITIKGVNLGTAGVFLVAILFGYLCTLPGLQNIPVLDSFFMADSSSALTGYYSKIIQNVGLVLFVTSVGFIKSLVGVFMIRSGNWNFTQISNLLSFNTPQYFTTVFRRITGMTPSEYVDSVRSNADGSA
jgi:hypothetical protein